MKSCLDTDYRIYGNVKYALIQIIKIFSLML